MHKKVLLPIRSLFAAFALLLLAESFSLFAEEKFIRLRNEVISTPEPVRGGTLQAQAVEEPLNGLYFIQFTSHFEEAWSANLRPLGVELVQAVPDDAYVASLTQVSPAKLKSLNFVRWVGPVRSVHKLHPKLQALALQQGGQALVPLRLLLKPNVKIGEVQALTPFLSRVKRSTKFKFGTVVEASAQQGNIGRLASLSSVLWVEPVSKLKMFDEISSKIVAGDDGQFGTRSTSDQLGFGGQNVVVSVADSGLDNGLTNVSHPDLMGRVDATFFYGDLLDSSDEHGHGTHVAGIIAGNGATGETDDQGSLYGLGVAPEAHLVAQRIFDGVGGYTLNDDFNLLTHDALQAGAVIGSNSWGDDTQGEYNLNAAEFDALVRDADVNIPGDQPYILEFSAGNAGPGLQTIGSPAVAKNVIATGASENNRPDFFIYVDGQEAMADFSSRGPCADGRIKPDVVAPGTWIASLQSSAATDENAWLGISPNYQYEGGTSQAGPHVSGAAAVFVQYYRETHGGQTPSPALVKAALINCAVDMDNTFDPSAGGTGPVPNNDEGWGRVDLTQIIGSDKKFTYLDQTTLLKTGDVYEQRTTISGDDNPLKITLVYTDVPGTPMAIPALVNDLDLEVIDPNGDVFHGNQFDNGDSVPNPPGWDNLNNVEAVHLATPVPGEYIIRVHGRNIMTDSRRDTAAVDQDFALVVSGTIPLPGAGVVFMDRKSYTVPGTIKIRLIDLDLINQPTISVKLTSATEANGETVLLTRSGNSGVFTGQVATALGPAVADGKLQIKHGDAIKVSYQDASPAGERTASAIADLLPPVVSNVAVTNSFGRAVLLWNTDEPARSQIFYGQGANPTIGVTNNDLTTDHEIKLPELVTGASYSFYIVSTDEAGNTSTNNNNGKFYQFVAPESSTILLVYGPEQFLDIPMSTYTDPLSTIGISYDVWDLSSRSSPTLADLKPYHVVIWRIPEFDLVGLSTADQESLRQYVKGGGSLMMASMELLSRLGNSTFAADILQVQSFQEDAQVPSILGVDSDSITSGIDMTLDYTYYQDLEALGQTDFSDTFNVTTNGVPILFEPSSGKVCGVRYPKTGVDAPGRVVFMSIALETVPDAGDPPNNRVNLLRNILGFLAPGANGLGTIALDQQSYRLPAQVTVEIADSDLAGKGTVTATASTDTPPGSLQIKLNETPRAGVFRGFFTVAATNAPIVTANTLRVAPDAEVFVAYNDESSSSLVQVLATIDLVAPVIQNVHLDAAYNEALISWDTSEPADALVQFGESTFLGRTAYSSEFAQSHQVDLQGLDSDKTYYYQVVSRDPAGNTSVDDNKGKLYKFTTLRPKSPPWFDDLEGADVSTNWLAFKGQVDSDTGDSLGENIWTLGTPNNGVVTAAHSGKNAWCSNIDGQDLDISDTSLISPAIELKGGSAAYLQFWHNYDFSLVADDDIYQYGELYISTNNGNSWSLLQHYEDVSDGWELAEINLNSYIGSVVQFGWYHGLFAIDSHPRAGWVVDDISVIVTNSSNGSIQITNNLAQAGYTLTGPLTRSGTGWGTTITNAPFGTYVIQYSTIPYYDTPPPQTNVLAKGAGLVFQGNYTFKDANGNGLPDAWEIHYFGSAPAGRSSAIDSDGDGASDLSEFLSGTDPKDPASLLIFSQIERLADGRLRLHWRAVSGYAYRISGSSDMANWAPYSSWIFPSTEDEVYTLPNLGAAPVLFFRIEVRP